MSEIGFSISPLPPFISLQFNLPVEKTLKGLFSKTAKTKLAGDLIAWCLQEVLGDQFTEGDAAGAWSRRYPEYLEFYYGDKVIPGDVSIRDSITFSAWVAEALVQYRSVFPTENFAKAISPRLGLLKDYLRRHYDPKIGGFGLATRVKSRGPANIDVDLRHTAWALITLWKLGQLDLEIDEMIRKACAYISKELVTLNFTNERCWTYATLHKLLTTNGLYDLIMPIEVARHSILKRIESSIVEKFDRVNQSWELDSDNSSRAKIDNVLFICTTMPIKSVLDKDCANILQIAITNILKNHLMPVDKKKSAIPFCEDGKPDIGASLQILLIIFENRDFVKIQKTTQNKLLNFVVDPLSRNENLQFAYPWHLVSALRLASA